MCKSFVARWRDVNDDPPTKSGQYIVANRHGHVGQAVYTAQLGDTAFPLGWANRPMGFGFTHWLEWPSEHVAEFMA